MGGACSIHEGDILVGKPEWKENMGDLHVEGRVLLK
jgi:hypothetical protein